MSLLTEIKTKLDALGTLGQIVIGYMPPSPDVIGVLYEYSGQSPERRFGVVGIGYDKPAFQLVFRGAAFDYVGPETKAKTAAQYLMSVQPGPLGAGVTTIYLEITPIQSPFPVAPRDNNNRHAIGCNFYCKKELSV